ncbi:MAG TPA: MOSC domain-containing protein [Thermoleophilaceae bacterium]|nr:MOSC domain-containing protein [Thermoleophilaceae bacterium]
MNVEGYVEAIFIGPDQGGPLGEVEAVAAVAGEGLEGDRKHIDALPPRKRGEPGRNLTLIEAEALDALAEEHGIELGPGEARRQIYTRGIRLNPLVGKRFTVGDVECVGVELCEPCAHLQSLTPPGTMRGLVHRGGLRADILTSGTIRTGDPVREVTDRAEATAS